MLLTEKLYQEGVSLGQAWNFGPPEADAQPVEWIVKNICRLWGKNASYHLDPNSHPHEATYLKLDCSKARNELGWLPRWNLKTSLEKIVQWNHAYQNKENMRETSIRQITEFEIDPPEA